MTVTYYELKGSPEEQHLPDGHFKAIRRLQCAWSDRTQLAYEIGAVAGELYPHKTSYGARAVGMGAEPFPGEAPTFTTDALGRHLAVYEDALITVEYSTKSPVLFNQYVIFESLEPNSELQQMPYSKFCWDSVSGTALQPGEAPTKAHDGFDYVLTYFNIYSPPAAAITLNGYCNALAVPSYTLGVIFGAETLKYHGPASRRRLQPGLIPTFTLTYRFAFRSWTWNKFWRPETGQYETMYWKSGTGRYINVPLGDFSLLAP